jgi:hypothetical protein
MKRALTLLLACLSASAAAAQPAPSAPARLTMGDPRAEHVNVTLAGRGRSARALVVETRRVGAPGSRLRLSVDRRRPFLSLILDADQCRFDDFGSVCTVSFPLGSLRMQRRTAQEGRCPGRIENAGNWAMSRKRLPRIFTKAPAAADECR